MLMQRTNRRKHLAASRVAKQKKTIFGLVLAVLFYLALSSHLLLNTMTHDSYWGAEIINMVVAVGVAYGYTRLEKELNLWIFGKLGIIFLLYQLVSYWLAISSHLNNYKWHWQDLAENQAFQTNYLMPLLAFMLALLAFNYFFKNKIYFKRPVSITANIVISQYLAAFCLTDSKMFGMTYFSHYYSQTHVVRSLLSFLLLYLFYSLFAYSLTMGLTDKLNNRVSINSATTMSFLLALIFNFWAQFGIKDDVAINGFSLFPAATTFQLVIFTLLFLMVFLVLNRFLLSTLIIVVVASAFSLANQLKFASRNDLVVPSDLGWIRQIGLLLSFVNKTYIIWGVLSLLLIVGLYIALRRYVWKEHIVSSWKIRTSFLAAILLVLGLFSWAATPNSKGKYPQNIPVVSLLTDNPIDWTGNIRNAQTKSLAFVWIRQLTTEVIEQPAGYSKERMESLSRKYATVAEQINRGRTQDISKQTVIFVLSESFANPARLDGINLSQANLIPNISAVESAYTSGLMKSDGYGGGTANMEFQSLTGLPMYHMSPTVSTIYTEVASRMAYIPAMSNLYASKDRIAVHFESAGNYSRNTIYQKMGYSKFYALSNSDDIIPKSDVKLEGLHPSDASTYQLVLDKLSKTDNQFFSVMTMQNHMPWSSGQPANVTASGTDFTEDENNSLTSYSRLLTATDKSTANFLNQLAKVNKRISVVFYGDHLPGFYPDSTFKKHPESQYQTDYFIWSNYNTKKYPHNLVNSSDLPAALLETTNSKVSPYYALLTEVMNNSSVDKDQKKLKGAAKDYYQDLKLVEYDLISGKGYLNKSKFYQIEGEK